jgi:ssDNA-binding Zn-finger/Zn-ribbon topoisomerase 1
MKYGQKYSDVGNKTRFKKGHKDTRSNDVFKRIGDANRGPKHHNWGKHSSVETRQKQRYSQIGEKGSNWRGGITPLNEKIRKSLQYKLWRQQGYVQGNFTCEDCDQHGGILRVHHKKPFSILAAEAIECMPLLDPYEAAMVYTPLWDVNNGVVLCEKCHKIRHKKRGLV